MKSTDTRETGDDFSWGALAARVRHPVRVETIEAMAWIDQPLSADDLLLVLEGRQLGRRIEYHLNRLVHLGAIAPADTAIAPAGTAMARDSLATRIYRLGRRPRS